MATKFKELYLHSWTGTYWLNNSTRPGRHYRLNINSSPIYLPQEKDYQCVPIPNQPATYTIEFVDFDRYGFAFYLLDGPSAFDSLIKNTLEWKDKIQSPWFFSLSAKTQILTDALRNEDYVLTRKPLVLQFKGQFLGSNSILGAL